MTPVGTILLEDDHACVVIEGQVERTLAYDDVNGWLALKAAMETKPRFTAIVPASATFRMALATAPRSTRELRQMLKASAPLALRELLWTAASPGEDAAHPTVVLVKRDWLVPRTGMIQQMLEVDSLLVEDMAREPFHSLSLPASRDYGIVAMAALITIVLAGALAWQVTKTIPAAPEVATLPATMVPRAVPATATPVQPAVAHSSRSELVLVGIAGRLPDDADVLVKAPWGKTSTMRMGDSLLGWTLVAVAPDRIVLEKDGARDELVLNPPA